MEQTTTSPVLSDATEKALYAQRIVLSDSQNCLLSTPVMATSTTSLRFDSTTGDAALLSEDDLYVQSPNIQRLAYFFFVLQGIGMLFPWNCLLGANEFYESRLSPQDKIELLPFGLQVVQLVVVLFTTIKLLFVFGAAKWLDRVPVHLQLIGALGLNTVLFVIMTLLPVLPITGRAFYGVLITLVLMTALCTAVQDSGTMRLVSQYPPHFTQALYSGQGVAGIVSSLSLVFTKMARVFSDKKHAHQQEAASHTEAVYFGVAFLIVLMCAATLMKFTRTKFYRYHSVEKRYAQRVAREQMQLERRLSVSQDELVIELAHGVLPKSNSDSSLPKSNGSIWQVYPHISFYGWSVFISFLITLSIFPGLTFKTRTMHPENAFWSTLFVPVALLLFNVGDWIGKQLPRWIQLRRGRTLLMACAVRFIFIPAFLLCNIQYFDATLDQWLPSGLPSPFSQDATFLVFMLLFAMSHGCLVTLAMMHAPSQCSSGLRERAGGLMVVFLMCGLAAGAYASFGVSALLSRLEQSQS